MIHDYFAANLTSAPLMAWATFFGALWLVCKALQCWDARFVAREIRRLERQGENRHHEWAWTWGLLIADGTVPTRPVDGGGWELVPQATRRISQAEWRGASAEIQRELGMTQWN